MIRKDHQLEKGEDQADGEEEPIPGNIDMTIPNRVPIKYKAPPPKMTKNSQLFDIGADRSKRERRMTKKISSMMGNSLKI